MLLGNVLAACSKCIFPPRLIDATIFCISTTASFFTLIPPFRSFCTTVFTALRAISSDLEPVHTILPDVKINVAVFGLFNLNTRPGN